MVKFLRALVCALLAVTAVVAAAPRASAAPLPAPYGGQAIGVVAAVDLDFLPDTVLTGIRLVNSEATADSIDTPRASSVSRNLTTEVAGLDLAVETTQQTAPPDNAGPATGSLAAASDSGVSTGAITTSNEAHWAGDDDCVTDGPIAQTTTSTSGLDITSDENNVLTTGLSSVTTTTGLVSTVGNGLNRRAESEAIGRLSDISLFDGAVTIEVAGDAMLNASADGTTGGADFDYEAPVVSVTFEGDTTEVAVGDSFPVDLGAVGNVTVTVNAPAATLHPAGLRATAAVAVVSLDIGFGTEANPTGTAAVDLLSLTVSASVPAGGIDCPPPAPTVDVPADGAVINDSTPAYSGTGIPGAIIDLVVDGTMIEGVATVDEDGDWTFTPTAPLADGPHTVSATQSVNDVESESSAGNEFLVDTAAPAAPVITAPEDGSTTSDNTPTITGTGEPGAAVTVEIDGVEVGVATVQGDGTWSLPLIEPLDDGEHTVSATQTDDAGNESGSDEVRFVVDTEARRPVITAPADGTSTNDTTPTIVGTGEPGAEVAVSIDGAPVGTVTVDGDGDWSLPLTEPLAEGEHTVTAVQTDEAGNTSAAEENEFTVDITALAAPAITSPEDGSTLDDPTPTIRGTGEPGTTVVVLVDGEPVGSAPVGEDGNWSLTLSEPLADGDHTIEARAIDDAGNDSGVAGIEFTVDVGEVILTPTDGPILADTGGPGLGYAVVGGVLLLVGGTVLSLTRRRA